MIVVFGSRGQVGRALTEALGECPTHLFLHRESRDYCGELTNLAGITETLMELKPEIIINAAAYTAVDQAETHSERAFAINAHAAGAIAQIAAKLNALLVHYSTDYVFNGAGSRPWHEGDSCQPLSIYGKSKHAGEEMIEKSGVRHFILRTSWVYSHHGTNFLKTMLKLADVREEIRVVSDQWGAPTHASLLAETTLNLVNLSTPGLGSDPSKVPPYGIYHCAPSGETSWFEYAKLAIDTAKSAGAAQACQRITPIPTASYPTAAQRPLNSRLDTNKLKRVLDTSLPDWREAVVTTVREILDRQQPLDSNYGK
jgi:dTDP-4-dehydrorhamnose reductase